jgi:hypothetical protein
MNKPTHILTTKGGTQSRAFCDHFGVWLILCPLGATSPIPNQSIHSLTPIEAEKSDDEKWQDIANAMKHDPNTFDWKQAMKLFADGVELQHCVGKPNGVWAWHPSPEKSGNVQFYSGHTYRRKPVEPLIEKSYQGIDQVGTGYLIHTTLESAKKNYPSALAYLELTYKDGLPVEARVIGKDQA